jgi:hypothetical protein
MLDPADSKLVTGSPSRCNRRVESSARQAAVHSS